ncbi:MAG: hypothetical protein Q8Q50_04690 [Methylobacter sp.]|nr:hypothetical protein [Methylobacter sp.]
MKKNLFKKSIVLLTITSLMSGCYSFGPDGLKGTHPLYNTAIVESLNEQFIQNIVRLHYRDPAFFLDVVSVTASLKMDLAAGMDQSAFDLSQGGADVLQFSAAGAYSSTPTIAYAPMQGENFVKSVLEPIAIEDTFALMGSGWTNRRVLSLCVEKINDLDNASGASGPTPQLPPKNMASFERLLHLFDEIRAENLIVPIIDSKTNEIKLAIKSSVTYQNTISEIKQLLGLDPNLELYRVTSDFVDHKPDTISIRTRSLMSVFFYLSHNVDTPPQHKEAGLVTVTRNKDGSEFNWANTAGGKLFHIHQKSGLEPDMAFVTIPYRGQWFYIADNDLESKSTFMLLSQLFRLQAGAAKANAPTLTIPVR